VRLRAEQTAAFAAPDADYVPLTANELIARNRGWLLHNLPIDHTERSRYLAARDALEARFKHRVLSVDDVVVRRWGAISGTVKRDTGVAPGVIDTLLAATAIENRMFLVTCNVKDVQHSGAAVFNPWEDDPSGFVLA